MNIDDLQRAYIEARKAREREGVAARADRGQHAKSQADATLGDKVAADDRLAHVKTPA